MPTATRLWSWPSKPNTFAQLLASIKAGFGLLMIPDQVTGKVSYKFTRGGATSEFVVREDLAIALIRSGKLGHGMSMPDRSTLYMQTTRC